LIFDYKKLNIPDQIGFFPLQNDKKWRGRETQGLQKIHTRYALGCETTGRPYIFIHTRRKPKFVSVAAACSHMG
jgi:hypothetical protein